MCIRDSYYTSGAQLQSGLTLLGYATIGFVLYKRMLPDLALPAAVCTIFDIRHCAISCEQVCAFFVSPSADFPPYVAPPLARYIYRRHLWDLRWLGSC